MEFVFADWIIQNTFLCADAIFIKCPPLMDGSVISSGQDLKKKNVESLSFDALKFAVTCVFTVL